MKLYKYVCYCRRDILEGARVRFTQPSDLNDPFEMKPYFEELMEKKKLKAMLIKHWPDLPTPTTADINFVRQTFPDLTLEQVLVYQNCKAELHPDDLDQQVECLFQLVSTIPGWKAASRKSYHDGLDDRMGVFCLSETATDVLLWAHYADNHKGFLIEFDKEHEFFHRHKFKDGKSCFRQVRYLSGRPHFETATALNQHDVFFTKSKAWEYEREWRMVLPLQDANHRPDGRICLFDFPPTCITGLIFGSNMPIHEQQAIRELVASDGRYTHVKVYQANISETKFEIEIQEQCVG